jgi:hypothetical protein
MVFIARAAAPIFPGWEVPTSTKRMRERGSGVPPAEVDLSDTGVARALAWALSVMCTSFLRTTKRTTARLYPVAKKGDE